MRFTLKRDPPRHPFRYRRAVANPISWALLPMLHPIILCSSIVRARRETTSPPPPLITIPKGRHPMMCGRQRRKELYTGSRGNLVLCCNTFDTEVTSLPQHYFSLWVKPYSRRTFMNTNALHSSPLGPSHRTLFLRKDCFIRQTPRAKLIL